jgi:hypothetical protein
MGTTPSSRHQPIFHYVIAVRGKEFPLVIMADGISHWDDHTERLQLRSPQNRYLEIQAFAGDREALRQLGNELLEFTITVRVPEDIVAKAREMARKERRAGQATGELGAISAETMRDGAEMDRLLLDFFWKEINPLLNQPVELSSRQ